MAILEQNLTTQIGELNEYSDVKIECPICKARKVMKFPKSVISKSRHLTTISLPKGLVCDHHFQAFLDKNFAIRGYQKVDFEFENKKDQKQQADIQLLSGSEDELFDHLILEGNYVKFRPTVNKKKKNELEQKLQESKKLESKRSLKDVYNEFWEFIDDNNSEFKEFISKDKRRLKLKLRS